MKAQDGHVLVRLEVLATGWVITHAADCEACQDEIPVAEFVSEFIQPYEGGYILPPEGY